ncbi:phosphate system positive regulatory protein Pho81p [Monosporozyma unispora]|nr:phosphate system positive regulatory protein pho81 [Kazachstania unispora]
MKFGKYLEGRELELPEYNGYFMDYKALKKLIKQLSLPNGSLSTGTIPSTGATSTTTTTTTSTSFDDPFEDPNSYKRLQKNKASFFFKLEREVEKVNSFYLQKESDLKIKFNILNSKYHYNMNSGKLHSRNSLAFKSIYGRFIKFQKDLISFEQYVELNKTGFSKALKKWDKRSHSQDKDFYLATVVSVQPVFTRIDISKLNDETLNILIELNDLQNNNNTINTTTSTTTSALETHKASFSSSDPNITGRTPFSESFRNDMSPITYTTPSEIGITPQVMNNYTDFDSEIEDWYLELTNISKLKDDLRRKDNLQTFYINKIKPVFVETNLYLQGATQELDRTVTESLSKLFLLLVGSKMKDEDLMTFYNTIKSKIDLAYIDEDDQIYSKKNILHEATHCLSANRDFVIKEVLTNITPASLHILINAKELHKRTPLHFAAELGKLTCVQLLLSVPGIDSTIDSIDDDYDSPLVLAIKNNHINIVKELLKHQVVLKSLICTDTFQFSPLLVACKYNNLESTQIILDIFKSNNININTVVNTEGLGPLHVTSRLNEDVTALIKLLIDYGLDPNGIDDFNKFSPIFYAIKACNVQSVKTLLENGADITITDEYGRTPMFYVLWDSNVEVLNEVLPYVRKIGFNKENSSSTINNTLNSLKGSLLTDTFSLSGDELNDLDNCLDDIPDFTLPPPIIPLKKYGHNYLMKKISIKLTFERNENFVEFNPADETIIVPDAGRITVTSNYPDNLPRNIILRDSMSGNGSNYLGKFEENKLFDGINEVIFQVDKLEDFIVDFEIYPEFGTRLISKTTCMPFLFDRLSKNLQDNIFLPLFDTKLNNIGSLKFKCQIIFPYSGRPLQIDKYEPYWKSTTNNNGNGNAHSIANLGPIISNDLTPIVTDSSLKKDNINTQVPHYITSSSIGGTFTNIKVYSLEDGTLITSPECWIDFHGVKFLFSNLSKPQLEILLGRQLSDITAVDVDTEAKLQEVVKTRTLLFDDLLHLVPYTLQLIIQVCYPTDNEIELIARNVSSKVNLNTYIDNILYTVFEHERTLRHTFGILRSIIFSSCNWKVCSILNWKQPNFPVLLEMNALMSDNDDKFIMETPHNLRAIIAQEEQDQETLLQRLNKIDKKIHVKEMIEFGANNNVFGVIIPYNLLKMCSKLVASIKNQELLLVGSITEHDGMFMNSENNDGMVNGFFQDSKLVINQDEL